MAKKTGAVLVVGGGIAGIAASLDLAETGFKVYLLEKEPAIGGRMAQLDKTFPTNDCAMCTLAPRLVDVAGHPNIELITYGEVEGLKGEAGKFTVSISKKPRYIDSSKCTGCGVCVENCPVKYKIYMEHEEKVQVELSPEDLERMKKIIDAYKDEKGNLLPVLHDVNIEYRYLPEHILRYVSEELDLPLSMVYQIATFYNAFKFTPRGLYTISVCMGTACYIKGGPSILSAFERELGIKAGETTKDLKYSLETIACLGCCSKAPALMVNEEVYGHVTQAKVEEILKEYH
ncbi:NADH-quinone oxidoreductase subunit NuoE [bacterium]|nr:NADH-quinone oxidoreductase subunit NuoE [bacterium]MBU0899903.1 NADH-quinone oxidoreductase subunit NuoE [bacterium]MBU1153189.1 NADH-quinone oxidoreductase subunit NuoE [bacterium]MBU2599930.1 NADH-quinone oxidoreductase subunit NuoE [bacterium]